MKSLKLCLSGYVHRPRPIMKDDGDSQQTLEDSYSLQGTEEAIRMIA